MMIYISIHCEIITAIKVNNTSSPHILIIFLCLVRTLKIYFLAHFKDIIQCY